MPNEPIIFHPGEVVGIFSNYLAGQSSSGNIITITGIYKRGKGNIYNGVYYDILQDENTNYSLTLKISESIRSLLKENTIIEARGILERRINNNCSVTLQLLVTEIHNVKSTSISEDDYRFIEILQQKRERGYKKVELLLKEKIYANIRPRIALLFPDTSIADQDFDVAKGTASQAIDFYEFRTPFSRVNEFVKTLTELDNKAFDCICISRGGGSGLDALDKNELLECVAQMQTPVISAVGHENDRLRLDDVCDYRVGTPSLLGQFFTNLVETVSKEKNNSLAAIRKQVESEYEAQIKTLNTNIELITKELEVKNKIITEANKSGESQIQLTKTIQEQNTEIQRKHDNLQERANIQEKTINHLELELKEQKKLYFKQSEQLKKRSKLYSIVIVFCIILLFILCFIVYKVVFTS